MRVSAAAIVREIGPAKTHPIDVRHGLLPFANGKPRSAAPTFWHFATNALRGNFEKRITPFVPSPDQALALLSHGPSPPGDFFSR